MDKPDYDHVSILKLIEAFLKDKRSQNLSPGTLYNYDQKIHNFYKFCQGNSIEYLPDLGVDEIRSYLIYLSDAGHNEGGVHVYYRVLKTFMNWYENEFEPLNWRNPMKKIKSPRLPKEILPPADLKVVEAMLNDCDARSTNGVRDYSLMLTLLDTGVRAMEACGLDLDDVNLLTGEVFVRRGKGRKSRKVFIGKKCRKALRRYISYRSDDNPALWIDRFGMRITYDGIRQIMRRRAEGAGVPTPSIHSFRRAFAINMLRAGVDVYRLKDLMGHADLQVLSRYLQITDEDLHDAHNLGSPVDRHF